MCEPPDRGRIVKRSIPTLIIDKYKVDEEEKGRKRGAESDGVGACKSLSWVS